VLDYHQRTWPQKVKEITKGRGVELILDPIGGKNFKINYRLLRPTGRLGMFGISATTRFPLPGKLKFLPFLWQTPFFHPISLMNTNRGVFGVNLAHLWQEIEKVRHWMEALVQGVHEGWIHPHVDRTFPLSQAAEAHRYIESRQNIGKVVLTPEDSSPIHVPETNVNS